MAKKEWIINSVLLLIGIVFTEEAWRLGIGNIHSPGKGFLPSITGMLLVLIAIFSLFTNLQAMKRDAVNESNKIFSPAVLNVIAIIGALIIYTLILPWLGYVVSTFVLMISLFKLGGFRKWTAIVAASFLTISISYIIFNVWLHVRFPTGVLGF